MTTQKRTVKTDTLVKIKVATKLHAIKLDSSLAGKITLAPGLEEIVLKKEDEKVKMETRIDKNGKATMICECKADSLEAVIKLQNTKEEVYTKIIEEYEQKDTLFKKIVRKVGSTAGTIALIALVLLFLAVKFKSKLGL